MVRLVLLALLVLVACDGGAPRPGIPPRHALLITVEGLRADHCSAYLYHRDTTTFPIDEGMRQAGRDLTLDELAHAGTLFTQAFAPTGHALDSIVALHTGRRPDLGRAPGQAVSAAGAPTLAQAFRAAGFETAGFASFEGQALENLRAGFDHFECLDEDRATLRNAIEYVDGRDWGDGRGVFLWLHLRQPAQPFRPYILPNHAQETINYPNLFADPGYDGERDSEALLTRLRAGEALMEPELRYLTDLYDGELALTNYLLFYFLDYFRYNGNSSGVWRSTVTVLAGANGVELDQRAGLEPWESLRDSGLRVPLLLRHPDSLTGRRIFAELVTLADVAPTLAGFFDLDVTFDGDGRSLLAVTDSYVQRPFERRSVVTADGRGRAALRNEDWRLVAPIDGSQDAALYRIERMHEVEQNVAARYPAVVDQLSGELRAALAGAK